MTQIETVALNKDRTRFRYKSGPLRFQVPRGVCSGVNAFKSLQIDCVHSEFIDWWRQLEVQLCPLEPFNSNLKGSQLRLKIDDSVYVFDKDSKQINPEIKEGVFRGQDTSCMIDVDSTYFFNGNWGLTVRIYQIKTLTDSACVSEDSRESFSLPKGTCAFLSEE